MSEFIKKDFFGQTVTCPVENGVPYISLTDVMAELCRRMPRAAAVKWLAANSNLTEKQIKKHLLKVCK